MVDDCVLDNSVLVKNVYKVFEFRMENAKFILKCQHWKFDYLWEMSLEQENVFLLFTQKVCFGRVVA